MVLWYGFGGQGKFSGVLGTLPILRKVHNPFFAGITTLSYFAFYIRWVACILCFSNTC